MDLVHGKENPVSSHREMLVRATPHKWAIDSIEIVSQGEQGQEEFFKGFVEKGTLRLEMQNAKG